MSVSKAKFEQKGEAYVAKQDAGKKRAKKKVRCAVLCCAVMLLM